MEQRGFESPFYTLLLFAIILLGLLATALDPTGLISRLDGSISLDDIGGLDLGLFILGISLIIVGMMIRLAAMASLKRNFSGALRIREGHTLVKSGIYHWIRHPAYLGAIILFLGIPIMMVSVMGFLVMSLLIPYLIRRIQLEEKMLIGHFGAEYEDYMRHSKRLIPFIY